ncbi:hypothetical protein [Ammoniphilus resinae]|uniref:VWFA domain-containing protein n=1 Tax=Ammoniphilus resinae TaxID=861532 RepID=A0ABS4GNE0_9BACL|nr:hypothetical protein [Ammoniphilus resinae]MBP1931790.1 hypothetical protein [Ammoniphilus resinae]
MSIATALQTKEEIIKNREGERLARYLRILFGNQKFGFKWSYRETSYTDGKDVYILYELQRPDCRTFTPSELRALRKWHSLHERGHIEYDIISDYANWQREWVSNHRADWVANEKYPLPWLQFFGNVMMDGRMENFTAIDHPTTKEYIEFGNYEWRFGIRGDHAGVDPIYDFRECFMSRALAMTDIDLWTPEAVDLVDSVQDLIEKGRFDDSTQAVLETTTEIIKKVWPTLVEWMDLQSKEPDDFDYSDDHSDSQWGDPQEVEENIKRVLRALLKASAASQSGGDQEADESSTGSFSDQPNEESEAIEPNQTEDPASDNQPSKPDFSSMLRLEEKQLEKDEEEAERELAPYRTKTEEVTVHEHRKDRAAYSSSITIKPYPQMDKGVYDHLYGEIKRHVLPTAKALSGLLEGIPDESRKNQRSGRILASRAWRADKLGDANVFEKRAKGTPGKNARVLILNDCSGSTGSRFQGSSSRIIDEMKKAQVLMVEACDKANLPVASYGFTEDYREESIIYPLKPYGRFSSTEKGFIGGVDAMYGNRDTLALQWAVDELARYPEDVRVLIMLSDGEPCFADHEDYDTMRSIVLQAEKRGIEVLCLYVGPQEPRILEVVRQMYPGRSIIVSNNLAKSLTTHVKRIIRKRR